MERRSVAVFPLLVGPPPRVLLLHRVPEKGGGWQPVTGRVEDADADLEAAARRELVEETGLVAERVVDLDFETRFTGFDGVAYRERAFAALVGSEAFVVSAEHDDARLVPLDEAGALLRWDENKAALRKARERVGL